MKNSARTYWQQGGGDGDRVYCDICFKYSVILNGPGYAGELTDEVEKKMISEKISSRKISDLRRFCFDMMLSRILAAPVPCSLFYPKSVG